MHERLKDLLCNCRPSRTPEGIDALFPQTHEPDCSSWDHLGDARAEYQELADAFLKLVAEAGKSPNDFVE